MMPGGLGSGRRGGRSKGGNHSNAGIGRDVTSHQTGGNGRGRGRKGEEGRTERTSERETGMEEGNREGK